LAENDFGELRMTEMLRLRAAGSCLARELAISIPDSVLGMSSASLFLWRRIAEALENAAVRSWLGDGTRFAA